MILVAGLALAADLVVSYDLETSDGGFVSGGDLEQWHWGEVLAGPGASYDGTRAWGTNLATPTYLNDAVDTLEIPIPDLSTFDRPVLRFLQWYALGAGDEGTVEIDSGNGWAPTSPVYGFTSGDAWSGNSEGWQEAVVPLDWLGDTVRLRLVFTADVSGVGGGWFIDEVGIYDGDVAAPRMSGVTALGDTTDVRGPYVIEADVEDDSAVAGVTIEWSVADGGSGESVMAEVAAGHWMGAIPGQDPDSTVSYSLVASDGVNTTRAPQDVYSFRVYLPAPAAIEGPEGRVIGTETQIRWTAPPLTADLSSYVVRRGDGWSMEVAAQDLDEDGWMDATVPVTGEDDSFTVSAIYTIDGTPWEGDPSAVVAINAAVPELVSISPSQAYAGDQVRLTLTGRNLSFVQDEVGLVVGDGVTVESIEVQDVDVARATLLIDEAAEPGARTIDLVTPVAEVVADGVFTLRAADERPHLLAVTPASVRQGDSGRLEITWAGELGDELTVDLGEGVVINAAGKEDGAIYVDYTVAYSAPIGEHAVAVDDGVRRVDGVSIEVKDVLRTVGSCGLGIDPSWLLVGVAVAGIRRRRA